MRIVARDIVPSESADVDLTTAPRHAGNLSDDSAPAQRKSDRHETFANTRARRLALVLMGMSSMVTLAIAAAIWLAVR